MLQVSLRDPADSAALDSLIAAEASAKQRDRYRCVRLALDGKSTEQIELAVARKRTFVQKRVCRYRDGGLAALAPLKQKGRAVTPPRDREAEFKKRILAGPTAADGGVCTLRGRDARRILAGEFGAEYSLQGVYDLLHRLNLSCLKPRPRHRRNDPAAMERRVQSAPLLSGRSARGIPAGRSRSGSGTRPASGNRGP